MALDQRIVVRKRRSWKIFEHVVSVAYLKKKIKIRLKATVLKSLFNNAALLKSEDLQLFSKNR